MCLWVSQILLTPTSLKVQKVFYLQKKLYDKQKHEKVVSQRSNCYCTHAIRNISERQNLLLTLTSLIYEVNYALSTRVLLTTSWLIIIIDFNRAN